MVFEGARLTCDFVGSSELTSPQTKFVEHAMSSTNESEDEIEDETDPSHPLVVQRVVAAIIEEMKNDGTYDAMIAEQERQPGSVMRSRMTAGGDIEFFLEDSRGPPLWILFGPILLVVSVAMGACGWLAAQVYQSFFGRQAGLDLLYGYRGMLFGTLTVFVGWITTGSKAEVWSRLPTDKRRIVALLGAIVLTFVLAIGVSIRDFSGTLWIFCYYICAYLNPFKRRKWSS
jgi:hypothetical protein